MICSKHPVITCVMVTAGRFDCIKKSVACYLRQTYSNKQLVILSQAHVDYHQQIKQWIESLSRSDIQIHHAPSKLSLGGMRNTSVEIATGDIICQWDDDDLYHPDRLMTQYNVLRADSGRVASLYCDFLKYFKTTGEIYWCDWSGEPIPSHRFLCGAVMFHKEIFGQFKTFYPDVGAQSCVEEDLNVLEKLMTKGSIGPVFAGHQYVYVYHGQNTYDIDHHYLGIRTDWGKKLHSSSELLSRRELLENTFREVGIEEQVKVRSEQEVAFIYN